MLPIAPACDVSRNSFQSLLTMDGADISRRAAEFFRNEWQGESFMAIGMQDPVLGPDTMHALARTIRNCPPPLELSGAGHFVQEWGEIVASSALAHFGDTVSA